MRVEYKNKTLMKVCTNASIARKKHGDRMAKLLHQRVDELKAADSVEQMIQFGIGRCHPLCGDRKGQYAVDLVHPHRLAFIKVDGEIKIVSIVEIIDDYH